MKKIAVLLLAVLMLCALCLPLAAGDDDDLFPDPPPEEGEDLPIPLGGTDGTPLNGWVNRAGSWYYYNDLGVASLPSGKALGDEFSVFSF